MKTIKDHRDKILNSNITKTILLLALPIILGNILSTVYNLADTFWLGRIGKEAVAAPTSAWPVFFLFLSLAMGMGTAGVSLVSQYTGAGDHEDANKAAGKVYSFLLVLSLISGTLGFLTTDWILESVISIPQEVLPLASTYLKVIFLGLPMMFTMVAFRFILRGLGDMKTPLYVRAVAMTVDGVLNPFMILGIGPFPKWGVFGAAFSTVIGRGIASLISGYMLFTGKVMIDLDLEDLKPDLSIFKKIIGIGAPSSVSRISSSLGFIALMALVSAFGTVAVSAYGIGRRLNQIINIGIWGFSSAITTMVGQNIGAENKERAKEVVKKGLSLSGLITFSIALLIFLFREPAVAVFINEGKVIREGARFLGIFSLSIPFFGFFRILISTFRGTGHTKPSMALSLIRMWVLRLGLSYLLAFGSMGIGMELGLIGIWYGMALSNLIAAGLAYALFLTGIWKEKTIGKKEKTRVTS